MKKCKVYDADENLEYKHNRYGSSCLYVLLKRERLAINHKKTGPVY